MYKYSNGLYAMELWSLSNEETSSASNGSRPVLVKYAGKWLCALLYGRSRN